MKKISVFVVLTILLSTGIQAQSNNISKILNQDCVYDFSYKQYYDFLQNIKKIPEVEFVTQQKFNNYYDSTKIIVSIKHDIDIDIKSAIILAEIENTLDITTTYFVLHTAAYYHPHKDFSTHNETVLPQINTIKSFGHEIGFHNDLITLQVAYGISPRQFLKKELEWLRSNKINIYGTSSHGSSYCYKYRYLNYFFFEECALEHQNVNFPNEDYVIKDNQKLYLEKGTLAEYNLKYESYSLDFNKYYSDVRSSKTGIRNNPTLTDIGQWKVGDRIVILTHPEQWQNIPKNSVSINPNPNNNKFSLYSEDIPENTDIKIEIFNTQGKSLHIENKKYTHNITLSTKLKRGIYILKISYKTNNKLETRSSKLVIA